MGSETVDVRFAPSGLAQAVVCCIWRRVEGEPVEPVSARVPANTYACVNLVLKGRVALSTDPGGVLPDFFVTGPFTRALSTTTDGPLHSVSLVVQPWLLRTWFGWAPAELLDALQDLHAFRACAMADLLHRALVAAAPGPAEVGGLWAALQAALEASARLDRPDLALGTLLQDGVGAAARTVGLGERQYERRFGLDMGLPPRTWLRIRRLESAMVALAGEGAAPAGLARVAADTGYADQAHLTRAFREGTGEPPARLLRQLHADRPGYWAFRPARDGFVQDGDAPPA